MVNDTPANAANSLLVVVQIGDGIQVDPFPGNFKFFTKEGTWLKIVNEAGDLIALYNQHHVIAVRFITAEQMIHAQLLQASSQRGGAAPLEAATDRGSAG